MAAKRACLILAFLVPLVLASQSLSAAAHQRGGGGGSRGGGGGYRGGGGGYHGGGHAVPRGAAYHSSPRYGGHGGYSHGGHYGRSGHYGYYGHRGYYGGYGHAYYGYGRGYYGYGRGYYGYPYRSAWFYGGWPYAYGWGPSVSIGIGAHYDYPAYAAYGDVYAAPAPAPAPAADSDVTYDAPVTRTRDDSGRLRIAVTPADASLYVDDQYWGNTRQVRSLILRAGPHTIDLVRPGFAPARQEVTVARGETLDLRVEMQRP